MIRTLVGTALVQPVRLIRGRANRNLRTISLSVQKKSRLRSLIRTLVGIALAQPIRLIRDRANSYLSAIVLSKHIKPRFRSGILRSRSTMMNLNERCYIVNALQNTRMSLQVISHPNILGLLR